MGLEALGPVVEILNTASVCVIGSNRDAVGAGLASLELEGVDGGFSEKVGDSSDVFELITHCSPSTHQQTRQIFNPSHSQNMTSVQKKYAQRNNNLIKIVPRYETAIGADSPFGGPGFYMDNIPVYVLSLPTVQYTGGTFYVDLAENDTAGNPIRNSGRFTTSGDSNVYSNMILFALDVPFNPAYGPGLDFTIFFKNVQFDNIPLLSIGLVSLDGIPFPEIISPLLPQLIAPNISNNLTFKSDGTKYNVVSSGPAGWLGAFAYITILAQFGSL